jgi:beta-lactamase class A
MLSQCRGSDRNAAEAYLLWGPSRGGTQWLDISIFNDGFAPGTFISIGPLTRETWGFIVPRMAQATTHYARINTATSQGWKSSATLSFFTPICDHAAYYPAPAPDMVALQQRLADAVRAYEVNAAVAVTDLQTGETVHVNGDQVRLPGCTLNLFNLMQVVTDVQSGRYPETSVGDLIRQTINRSDAVVSRNLLKAYVGGGNVYTGLKRANELMLALGMTNTLYDHPPGYWEESLNGGIDNRTTAIDTNRGLRGIWEGRALLPGWRDYFLQKMTLVKPGLNYLVSVGTGGSYVSHKNGFLWAEGWVDNDIGIVWFERGGQRYGYAISYFSGDLTNKYDGIPLGQRLSVLSYAWFDARYNAP